MIESYLTDCEIRGLSHLTLDLYKMFLSDFLEVAPNFGNLAEFQRWLLHYQNQRTRHAAFRTVRTFIRWAARQGLCVDWITGIKVRCQPAPHEPTLSVAEFERLLAAIPTTTPRGRRDRALYATMFFTGARRDTIRLLRRTDVNLRERWLRVTAKGGKEAVLPLPRQAALLIHHWLIVAPASQWAFPSVTHPDKPVDGHAVSRRIHVYAQAAGFTRRVHVHLLRHSFASLLDAAQVPTSTISRALMHSSISTTVIYLDKLGGERNVREAVEKVFD